MLGPRRGESENRTKLNVKLECVLLVLNLVLSCQNAENLVKSKKKKNHQDHSVSQKYRSEHFIVSNLLKVKNSKSLNSIVSS